MKKPKIVSRAQLALWLLLAIDVIVAIIGKATGQLSTGLLIAELVTYALVAVLTFKICAGKNWARYVYLVLSVIGIAVLATGETQSMTKLEIVWSWLSLPVSGWTLYALFCKESSSWYERK